DCVNPNPCALRCALDRDCEDAAYCADGLCTPGCRGNPDNCGVERICDEDTRRCVRPTCTGDLDCPRALYCEQGECLPGCRRDPDNCAEDQYCNESNRCAPVSELDRCATDEECIARNGEGAVCVDGTCGPGCTAHADCPAGEACGADHHCRPGCRDDRFEDNDVRGEATPLMFNGLVYDSGPRAFTACAQDPDWYSFETPAAGTSIRVRVRFINADGDLDARLYAPDGREVDRAQTAGDEEVLEYLAGPDNPSPAGTWWIEVFSRGLAENVYRVQVDLVRGLGPDAAEPDNAPQTATALGLPGVQDQTTINDRTIHPGDEDWFALDMGARDGLMVRLEILGNDSAENDELDFALYGPGAPAPGEGPIATPNSAGGGDVNPRFVQFDAPRFNASIVDGRYYVRVFGVDRAQFARYRLTVAVDRNGVLCLPDASEPNDRAEVAFDLMRVPEFIRPGFDGINELIPGVDHALSMRTLCADDDWYSLVLRDGDDLEARIDRLEAGVMGDTIIEIRDARNALLASGRSGRETNLARITDVVAGRYLVHTQSVGATRSVYDFVVLRTAGPEVCPPDRFEAAPGNATREGARPIEAGEYADLTLCGQSGDEDWFSFQVDGLADVQAAIRFSHLRGDLELDMYYEDLPRSLNAELPDGHSATDDEVVHFVNRAPGTYYLRVRGLADPNVRYRLELTIDERVFVCEDDPDEPNDDFADAVLVGQQVDRETQWLCVRAPNDADIFQLLVPAGQSIVAATSFVFGDDGDLYLEAYDDAEMLRATTAEVARGNSKQCIIFDPVDRNRLFYLRISALSINQVQEDDERLDYRLRVQPGFDCAAIPPDAPGVQWPHISD
ncbi:MAG: PPC domain-containing protein, partial [Myxococcales bacterium]|nr:PPC domain-containing protein [Myxococcales bacterium]